MQIQSSPRTSKKFYVYVNSDGETVMIPRRIDPRNQTNTRCEYCFGNGDYCVHCFGTGDKRH